MRKLIFKGTINGKSFDNVEAYNEEMNRLLSSGAIHIDASSNTTVREECETCNCECGTNEECNCKHCKDKDSEPNFIMPGFDRAGTKYMDIELTEQDYKTYKLAILKELDKYSKEDLKYYYDLITSVLASINADADNTIEAIAELEKKADKIQDQIDFMNGSLDTIEHYVDFYNEIGKKVEMMVKEEDEMPKKDVDVSVENILNFVKSILSQCQK